MDYQSLRRTIFVNDYSHHSNSQDHLANTFARLEKPLKEKKIAGIYT
jgi:hypothetical protein